MLKTIVHLPTGEFRTKDAGFDCGPFEPPRPILSVVNGVTTYDPDYGVVSVSREPDPRTEKYDGTPEPAAKTAQELAAYDAKQPKVIRTRDLLRRITDAEHDAIDDLAKSNRRLRRLMHLMLSDGTTDVNHSEFIQGWQFIKSIGIPAIWPDAATADAAIARIRA